MKWFTLIIAAAIFAGCADKDMASNKSDECLTEMTMEKATSQDVIPGVYSNLRKTRNLELSFEAMFMQSSEIVGIQTDSTFVPVRAVYKGEDLLSNNAVTPEEKNMYQLKATRNFYNSEAPQILEEISYDVRTPALEEGIVGVWIKCESGEKLYPLGQITVLDPILAP